MLFCSEPFLLFFVLVFTAYWLLPLPKVRVYLLLGASIYFYASWNRWLAGLICVTSVMDYLIARGLDATNRSGPRKLLLGSSLVVNLGLLVYFKYANFFLGSLANVLDSIGMTASLPVLSVILPVGISFYTFEAINYTVDVYRQRVPAEKNLFHFMLFILFFPHLIAGPIVRARHFLPQTHRVKRWNWARLQLGVRLFLMGVFKKMVIADRMAQLADPVFANPSEFKTASVWVAMIAYALQIYCDFSGYTDMALGAAHMLGYKLAKNFNLPYLARNIQDFWRRWHISLSSWLRDYLFIPLGGSRGPRWRTNLNLLTTMTLGGLWHGASWTFVVWGLLHGMLLIVHRGFQAFCKTRPSVDGFFQSKVGAALGTALTFLSVCIGWVFFRAPSFGVALTFLRQLIPHHPGNTRLPIYWTGMAMLIGVVVACHWLAEAGIWKRWQGRIPAPVLGFGYAVVLTLSLVLAPDAGKAFIYFQF